MNYTNKTGYKQRVDQLTLQEILDIIVKVTGSNPKLNGRNYNACCPAHNDKRPSLSITQTDNGTILFRCFTGCSIEEICTSLHIKVRDLFPKKRDGASYG